MPLKIPVGRLGEWKHPRYGVLKMSQDTFDQMKQNFAAKAIGRDPYIRIGHDAGNSSVYGGAPALGWIKNLEQEGDVLYALAEPINEAVEKMIKEGQYRYASSEYENNYKDKESGSSRGAALLALSLTNEPFLTRLPEIRALSDVPDQFYLYEEESRVDKMDQVLETQKETNGLLRKLSDFFSGKKPEDNPNPAPVTPPQQPPVALLDPETQKKLADMQTELAAATATANTAREAQRTSEIERKLSDYTNAGIPPVYIDQARKILLGEMKDGTQEGGVVKLADDGFNKSTTDVYAMLDAFPPAARVPLNTQLGLQGQPPADEANIKLADETMASMGYKKNSDGKYVL